MNWTEGSLARHSRGRSAKETVLRQKQHFAKVRSGLSNSNSGNAPTAISFLGQVSSPHSSLRSNSSPDQKHGLRSTPSRKRRRFSLSSEPDNISHVKKLSSYFDVSQPYERTQQESTALDESRQRLLQKSDWVGIAMQKPLNLQFSATRSGLGHPWGDSPRRAAFRRSSRHIIGSRYDEMKRNTKGSTSLRQSPLNARDLRIRIGSREIQLGTASTSRANSALSSPQKTIRKRQASRKHRLPQRNASSSSTREGEPVIYQPIPRRMAISQLLRARSVDSQNAESTVANVGNISSPMSPSQTRDNDWWKDRIGLHDDNDSTVSMLSNNARMTTRDLTPGVSELVHSMTTTDQYNEGDTTTYAMSSTKESENGSASDIPSVETSWNKSMAFTAGQSGLYGAAVGDRPSSTSPTNMADSTYSISPNLQPQGHFLPRTESCHEEADATSDVPNIPSNKGIEGLDSESHATSEEQGTSPSLPAIVGGSEGAHVPEPRTGVTDPKLRQEHERTVTANPQQDLMDAILPEDENEVWRKFVFGISDDIEEKVLEEAKKEAARDLKPSEASTNADEGSLSEWGSNIETGGTSCTDLSEQVGEQDACASHLATLGSSSLASQLSDPTQTDDSLLMNTEPVVSCPTQATFEVAPQSETDLAGYPFSLASEPNSTTVEPAKSSDHEETSFRFARPSTFVGKLSGTTDAGSLHYIAPGPQKKNSRKAKSSRRAHATDGRTDIRALPNYVGDPIEEFDDVKPGRVEKSSLFGQLETQ